MFLNIALSGAVFAATYYGAAQNVSTNNLSVYFNVSPLLLIGCIAGVYLAVQLCAWAFGRPQQVRTIPFTARFEDGCVQGLALVDTGFSVRDPITGTPAFLLSFRGARRAAAAAAGAGALFRRRRHGDGRHAAAAHPHQNGGGHPCPACGART
ncbi:MAG: sigma-E processing peptidase SpoIIGA [Ruthenibacterium lactatiformans]